MAVREYIGARYVPIFADPIQWDPTTVYEPLTVVTDQGASYVSRQSVPTGIQLNNTDYWILWADYNAQLQHYIDEVQTFDGRIDDLEDALPISDYSSAATVKDAFTSANNAINKIKHPFNVKDYGAVGDGVTDDTDAFKATIAAMTAPGDAMYIPTDNGEEYLITDTLDFTVNHQAVYSDVGIKLDWQTGGIKFTPDAIGSILFNVHASGMCMYGVIMSSTVDYYGTAVKANMEINSQPDTDISFCQCYFAKFNKCIEHYNRGLKCIDNAFVLSHTAIEILTNANLTDVGNDTQRALVIQNNRFHVLEHCVNFIGAKPYGFVVENNLADLAFSTVTTGSALVKADNTSTIYAGKISGNVVLNAQNSTIDLQCTVSNLSICNNSFVQKAVANNEPIIRITTAQTNVSITGNEIGSTKENAIEIGTISNSIIGNNLIGIVAQASDASNHYAAIAITTQMEMVSIVDNMIVLYSNTNARCINYSGANAVNYCRITGNMSRRSEIFTNESSATVSNSIIQASNIA